MFDRKETKSMTAPSAKQSPAEALRSNLRELESGESQIVERLRRGKGDLTRAQAGLDLAEDAFVNGSVLFADLSAAREAVINALRALDPIEAELTQQRSLVERCRASLQRAEAEQSAQANLEHGRKFDAWRARFARALTEIVQLNLEGETIVAEASKGCPDLLAANVNTLPLRELSGRYSTALGHYTPTLSSGLRWLFDARRAGVAVPEQAIELLGEYIAQDMKLEALNEQHRQQREVMIARSDAERQARSTPFFGLERRPQFLEGGRVQ